jgi:hypothetical protein
VAIFYAHDINCEPFRTIRKIAHGSDTAPACMQTLNEWVTTSDDIAQMMVRHDWASYNSETWKKVTGEWTYKNFTQ